MDIDILEIVDNGYRGLSERSLGNIQLKYKSKKWREKRKESAKIYEMYLKFYGKEIELLGIDIVNQFCETLLYYHKEEGFPQVLNENGLCCDMNDCDKIIEFSSQIKVPIPETGKWKCLYIYKILC